MLNDQLCSDKFLRLKLSARLLALPLALLAMASTAVAEVPEKVTFVDHVLPIFRENCLACHDQGGRSADLSLETYNDTLTGGASGEVVEAGAADSSRLYQLMAHLDEPIMPPGSDKLPDEQLALVKAWIDGGLLENAGSKAKKSKKAAVAAFVPSADNRPEGEPAMPGGFFREPVVHSPVPGAVADVAASPWAPVVAVTGQRQVLLYHTDTRELLGVAPFLAGSPEVVRFSRNGDLLLVGGGQGAKVGVVHLWKVKTGKRIAEIGDELDTVLAADITSDHTLVAFGGPRRRVQAHRTADGELVYSITKHTDWVTALEFSPDGTLLVTADRAGNAHLWEAKTGRPVANLTGHKAAITAVTWRGDSQLLVSVDDGGEIRTWQTNGNPVKQWRGGSSVLDARFTKDGRLLTVGRDRVAKLWNTDGKELKQLGKSNDIALAIAPTFDEKLAVFADWTGSIQVAELESGTIVGQLAENPPTLAMRLATAEAQLNQASTTIDPAQQSVAAATMTLDGAKATVDKHQEQKQAAREAMASIEQQLAAATAKLEQEAQQLATADQQIAAAAESQKQAEASLFDLQEKLAALGNQEGEESDGEQAAKLEAEIAESKSALEAIQEQKKQTEANRPQLAKSHSDSQQAVASLKQQLGKQQEMLAALTEAEKTLPNIEAITAERDRLQQELSKRQAEMAEAEKLVANLKAEISEYASAGAAFEQSLAEKQQAVESTTTQLAEVTEKLTAEASRVEQADREISALEEQLNELKAQRRELAAAKKDVQQTAETLETQLGELAAEQEKLQKAVSDYKQAAELRQQLGAGN
ncbi:WD40 domain-containing protein [Aeoliella mucimassa]|uniref:Chromosome partition protein Smc n=1 Tax=Aeoliella mucimassa TaxID=2527972 RepID=A0A518ATR2_9BACT|nr:c-type cytochrome domain-containing protein [Aeoliella mucimassa]QDU58120.1 Chromosome partition protein Smc [Aeoliella mucimassa]